jgi:hypothetical protein
MVCGCNENACFLVLQTRLRLQKYRKGGTKCGWHFSQYFVGHIGAPAFRAKAVLSQLSAMSLGSKSTNFMK